MASIRKEIVIDVPSADAWAAIRDFGSAHRLFQGILADARVEKDARIVTFADGSVVRELIVDVDDQARRFVYAAVGGKATHHNASLQVLEEGEGRARVVWITDLLPHELAAPIRGLVERGAAAMKRTLESRASNRSGSI
jgi:carbon monoxide dehydrogenase subunit G